MKMKIYITPDTSWERDNWYFFRVDCTCETYAEIIEGAKLYLLGYLDEDSMFTITTEGEITRKWDDIKERTYLQGFLDALRICLANLERDIGKKIKEDYAPDNIHNARLLVKVYDGKYEIENMQD